MRARLWVFLLGVALPAFSVSLSDMPRAYPVPGFNDQLEVSGFVLADLDLDGKLDVVVDGWNGAIFYGRGDGSFDAGPAFVAGGSQTNQDTHSVVADLDGDRFPDIVSNDYRGTLYAVVLRRNLRGRSFADPVSLNVAAQPIAAADFTGDHAADILLSNGVLLVNDGHGAFTKRGLPDVLTKDAATGDFDGDGDLDVTVPYAVYLNDGHGSFTRRVTNHAYAIPVVADLDGDRRDDVIGLQWQERMLTFMPGATLLAGSSMSAGNNPRAGIAADFNNDGYADLAVARDDFQQSYNYTGVDVYLGDGHGGLTSRFRFRASFFTYYPIAAADLNRDGAVDLLVSSQQGVAVVLGNGDGTFRVPSRIPGKPELDVLGSGDLNGDGIDELLLGKSPFTIGWMNGDGNYTFESLPLSIEQPWTRPFAFGETSAARASLVIAIDKTVHVLSATAPGQWSDVPFDAGDTIRAVQMWREGPAARIAVITGDASMPLLKIFSTAGVELHRTTLVPLHPVYYSQTWQIDVVDVDRDGALDLILSALSSSTYSFHTTYIGADGYISTFRGHGDGTFGSQEMQAVDRTLWKLTIGDADRDGAVDVVAHAWTKPVTFLNDGHGRFIEREGIVTNFPDLIKDLDFDGLPDFHYVTRIAYGNGKSVQYSMAIPSKVFARRRRNAPPSLIGIDSYTYDLVAVDLDPPRRTRAARH